MRGLGGVDRELFNVPPHGFKLPTEAIERRAVVPHRKQFIDQAGYDVRAKRKSGRPVALLLPLEPSTLEKWLVTENV